MAYELAKAYVQIIPTTKGIESELENALGGSGETAGKTAGGKFSSGFGKAIGAVGKVAGAALVGAGAAMTAFTKSSVEAGMQFDSSMSQVAATMGVTVDQIEDLRVFAQEMGATTAFSATEAADALNYMALAGYDADTSMKMLPNVLNLAAAGSIDLASASDMVTDAQSALGLSIEETSTMVDQMAKASSKSNTSVGQLGEAFLKIGATARNLSGGTQELATMLAVLADNGIKGAEGGTHLRNILLSLQQAAEDGAVDFGDFSVSIYDSEGNMRSTVDIIKDMQDGLGDMSQEAKDAITSGVFNKTDLAAINALLGTSTDRFDELYGSIGDCSGAAQQMADTQLDNLAGDITLMQSAFEGLKIAISDGATPSIREAVQGITDIIDGMHDLVSGVEGGGEKIKAGFEKIVSGVVDGIPTVVEIFKSLIEGVGEMIPTVLPEIVTSLFDGVADLIENLNITELVNGVFTCLNSIIKSIVPRIPELLVQLVAGIIEALPSLFVGVGETIYNIFDSLFMGYNEFDKFKGIVDKQTEAWNGVTEAMATTKAEVENSAKTWSDDWSLLQSITDESGKVKQGYEGIAEVITDRLEEALGIEIDLVDGQIQNYQELQAEIDNLIQKKRAELLLEAEEEAYAEALKMRPELVRAVNDAENNLLAAEQALADAQMWAEMNKDTENAEMYRQAVADAEQSVRDMQAAVDEAASNLASNTSVMSQYMSDYTAVMQEDYAAIGEATATYTGSTLADLMAYQTEVANQLAEDTAEHDAWLAQYEKFGDDFSRSQAEMYAARIETDRTQIDAINALVEQGGQDFSAGYINGILSGEGDVKAASKQVTQDALDTLKNTQQSQSPSKLTQTEGGYFSQGYANGIKALEGTVASNAGSIASKATSKLTEAKSSAYTAGQNTSSGFANGIGSMSSYVWSAAQNIASSALNAIKSFLGVHSPSTELEWVGEMLDRGLALGIEGNEDLVLDAVDTVNEDLMGGWNDVAAYGLDINSTVRANSEYWDPDRQAAGSSSKIDRLISLLEYYLPDIADRDMVMDTGEVVGALRRKMDQALGQESVRAARRMA